MRPALAVALASMVAGCAIRPLPEDVAGLDTIEIVRKIRCEMREAVRYFTVQRIAAHDPQFARDLETGATPFSAIDRRDMAPELEREIALYRRTVVGYEFTFDITETNSVSAEAGLLQILDRGPFGIGVDAGKDLERQNVQNFRIIDSFENLVIILPDAYCAVARSGGSHDYPITGHLGLQKTVGTFLDLNHTGNLAGLDDRQTVPTFAETIQFTTTISGGINPEVELSPLGRGLQLASAGFGAEAARKDVHELVLVLTLRDGRGLPLSIAEARIIDELNRQERRELTGALRGAAE